MVPSVEDDKRQGDVPKEDTMAAVADKMGVNDAAVLDRTRKWLERRLMTGPASTAAVALLSRLAVSLSTNSPVHPTETRDAGATDASPEAATDASASDAAGESSDVSNEASSSLKTEKASKNGVKGAADGSDMDIDVEQAEEKRRGPVEPDSRRNNTETNVFPRNADGVQNQESSQISSLVGTANDLADVLDTLVSDDDEKPLTVSQVAAKCLSLVASDCSSDLGSSSFFRYVLRSSPDTEDSERTKSDVDDKETEEAFKEILSHALDQIKISSKGAVEARSDFEYVWGKCCDKHAVRRRLHQGNGVESKDTTPSQGMNGKRTQRSQEKEDNELVLNQDSNIKECAWKLSFVATLQRRRSSLVEEVKSATEPEAISETSERRRRLLTTAACVGLFLLLSSESASSKGREPGIATKTTETSSTVSPPPVEEDKPKESIVENDSPSRESPKGASREKGSSSSEASEEEDPPAKRRRLAIEDDAIAALSMMVTGSSSRESSPVNADVNKEPVDVLDTVLKVTIELQERLFAPGGATDFAVARDKLEDEIITIASLQMQDAQESQAMETSSDFQSRLKSIVSGKADRFRLAKVEEMLSNASKLLVDAIDIFTKENEAKIPDETRLLICALKQVPYVNEKCLLSLDSSLGSHLCSTATSPDEVEPGDKVSAVVIREEQPNHNRSKSSPASPAVVTVTSEPHEVAELVTSLKSVGDRRNKMVTDGMELNEWTASVLSLTRTKPNTRLLLYLDASDDELANMHKRKQLYGNASMGAGGWRSVIFTVLHSAVERMKDAESSDRDSSDTSITISQEDGEVTFDEEVMCTEDGRSMELSPERKICKAVLSLYYHALETILFHETARLKSASHPGLIQNAPFHRALLSCCYVCILKAAGSCGPQVLGGQHQALGLKSVLQLMECTPYVYLKVSEAFTRSLKGDSSGIEGKQRKPQICALPRILHHHLKHCEVQAMDSLLWASDWNFDGGGGSILVTISKLQSTTRASVEHNQYQWPPEILMPNLPEEFLDDPKATHRSKRLPELAGENPERDYVVYLLRKVLKVSYFRISALCNALDVPPAYPVASQIWVAFRYLLRHHIELLYNRHVDQLILCTLYGVCKILKLEPELTFAKTIDLYAKVRGREIGERECQKIVRHIRIHTENSTQEQSSSKKKKKKFGNVIHLYNQVYVPTMKHHLLQSKSLKKATAELQECMAGKSGPTKEVIRSADDATHMADRVVNTSNGSWPEPTCVPVKEGNVKLRLRLPRSGYDSSMFMGIKGRGRRLKVPMESLVPRTRTYYSFGAGKVKNLQQVNELMRFGGATNF